MFKSIRTSLFASFVGLISLFLVTVLVINAFFLDDIFIYGSKLAMAETAEALAEQDEAGELSEEGISEASFGSGLFIGVVTEEGEIEFNSGFPRTKMERVPEQRPTERRSLEGLPEGTGIRPAERSEINGEATVLLQDFMSDRDKSRLFYIEKDEGPRRSVILLERLSSGKILMIMKPIVPMRESSSLATVFTLVSGAVVLLVGSIGVFLISGRLTAPILNMDRVARKMALLDFSESVTIRGRDELGELGNSIQIMSENLHRTLNELQEANGKLQLEIEHERELDMQRRRFISSVSHELRTPLSMIQGYADGLRHGVVEDAEGIKGYCDVIVDETKKMSGLIRDMLDLSSYEAGAFAYAMAPFDLTLMIRKAAQRVDSLIGLDKEIIHVEGPDSCMAFGDEGRIGQILSNFVNNAMNHGAPGEAVRISYGVDDGNTFLRVFNHGSEIPPDELERIWDPFYKAGEGALSRSAGFGLGLAIAHAIAEAHGGRCMAENVDQGVAFSFIWPVSPAYE